MAPSRRIEFQCVQIQCPTPTIPVELVLFSTRQLFDGVVITPIEQLPPSSSSDSGGYRAELSSTLFDERRGGLFRSMEECEKARNEYAFTFDFSGLVLEAEALERVNEAVDVDEVTRMSVELPDDVMDILQTRNKHLKKANAEEEGAESEGVAKATKAEATDESLLKELESVLENI